LKKWIEKLLIGDKKKIRAGILIVSMKINMTISYQLNIINLKTLLNSGKSLKMEFETIKQKHEFIESIYKNIGYFNLNKSDKIIIIEYLKKTTKLGRSQIMNLCFKIKNGQSLTKKYQRRKPHRKYSSFDIKLLETTDELHLRLSAKATKAILVREYQVFNNQDYKNLSQISISHIDNLRKNDIYKKNYLNATKARMIPIGVTTKPNPNGKPGFIRVDSVFQGEIYHIHAVDEITQWAIDFAVERISHECMQKALLSIIRQFPFKLHNFHSDRGSEYINYKVAKILEKLHIKQSKSRSNQHNDNALIESKNKSLIRKNFGYHHLPKQCLLHLNYFLENYYNPYINYHRPCLFASEVIGEGKSVKRKYITSPQTPFEKLLEIIKKEPNKYLQKGINLNELITFANTFSDTQFAKILRENEQELFNFIGIINRQKGQKSN